MLRVGGPANRPSQIRMLFGDAASKAAAIMAPPRIPPVDRWRLIHGRGRWKRWGRRPASSDSWRSRRSQRRHRVGPAVARALRSGLRHRDLQVRHAHSRQLPAARQARPGGSSRPATRRGSPYKTAFAVQLCLDEAVANIEHGKGRARASAIDADLARSDSEVVLDIEDNDGRSIQPGGAAAAAAHRGIRVGGRARDAPRSPVLVADGIRQDRRPQPGTVPRQLGESRTRYRRSRRRPILACAPAA